jgi:hypothetical protein
MVSTPYRMPLTKEQKLYCDIVNQKLFTEFGDYLTNPSQEARVHEWTDANGGNWRIRAYWFDPESTDPARPPMLEVFARNHSYDRVVRFAAWFYQPGNGNECHPEYEGWRVHMA